MHVLVLFPLEQNFYSLKIKKKILGEESSVLHVGLGTAAYLAGLL